MQGSHRFENQLRFVSNLLTISDNLDKSNEELAELQQSVEMDGYSEKLLDNITGLQS